MTGISPSDRLVAILRQKLRDRAAPKADTPMDRAKTGSVKPLDGLGALASLEGADILQIRRACIQGLLSEQFGGNLLNDAQFQQIVTRVSDAMSGDTSAARLLDRVIQDLRSA